MPKYFDFEIELLDVPEPRPRRRFHLAGGRTTFFDLHRAIQDATGWRDSHLFEFQLVGGRPFAGSPADEGRTAEDAKDLKLSKYLADGGHYSCLYNYDFGDDWWVLVRVKETQQSEERFFRRFVAGEHAWPPDDCGGPRAFRQLRLLREKQQRGGRRMCEGEKEFLAWAEGWDSTFDLDATAEAFDCARKPKDRN